MDALDPPSITFYFLAAYPIPVAVPVEVDGPERRCGTRGTANAGAGMSSPRSPRSPLRGATRPSVVKLDSDAVGMMLQAARHAEEIHTMTREHASEMEELRDRMRAAEAERQRWEARSTQLIARLEQEQLRLASLKLAERVHGSAVDASRLRAESMGQRLADAGQLVRQAELQAVSHRALQLAAEDEAATAQAELHLLRQQLSAPRCDLVALPALRLEDPRVRPPSGNKWVARFSKQFGKWYWYHSQTSETRWDWPSDVLTSAPGRELQALVGVQFNSVSTTAVPIEVEIEEGLPSASGECRRPSGTQRKRRQRRVPHAGAAGAPCDGCAALRRKAEKLARKLRETEAQKAEMGQDSMGAEAPCDGCAALRRKVEKLSRKLRETEAQKVEMVRRLLLCKPRWPPLK